MSRLKTSRSTELDICSSGKISIYSSTMLCRATEKRGPTWETKLDLSETCCGCCSLPGHLTQEIIESGNLSSVESGFPHQLGVFPHVDIQKAIQNRNPSHVEMLRIFLNPRTARHQPWKCPDRLPETCSHGWR